MPRSARRARPGRRSSGQPSGSGALSIASSPGVVHASAVERAGLPPLSEGQTISFDVVQDKRSGKSAADNLQAV